jgi:Ca2+/Na+ antiporter
MRITSIIDGFNYEQNLAMSNILGSMVIIFSLFSIISIFYGEKLIIFFDLENRFPKISKFIQIRRKFQQYYLLMNIGLIIIVLLLIIYVNIIEFISHIK